MSADPLAFLHEPYRTRYREPATALWERLATVEPPPENPTDTQSGLPPEQYREAFQRSVVEHSIRWCERLQKPDWDPHAERRRQDAEVVERHETITNTARRLAGLLSGREQNYEGAVCEAVNASGRRLYRADHEPTYATEDLVAVLSALADWCERAGPPAKSGPWAHRTHVGPLAFRTPIDGRAKLPGRETCLGVCLVNVFRRATSGDRRLWPIWQNGERVPVNVGDPLWEHVANFMNVAVDKPDGYSADTARETVGKFLRKNEVSIFT